MASSGFTVTMRQPLDDHVVEAVREAMADEGFGVLSDIDVAGALQAELGVEHAPLRILGACNPTVAEEALRRDRSVALVVPCNVVLAGEGDTTTVTMADPRPLLSGPDLVEIAQRAAERREAAAARVRERSAVPVVDTATAPLAGSTPAMSSAHRPVGAVATLSPLYGHGDDTRRQLAARMTEEGVGILLLRRADGDVGAVSDRDIVAALGQRRRSRRRVGGRRHEPGARLLRGRRPHRGRGRRPGRPVAARFGRADTDRQAAPLGDRGSRGTARCRGTRSGSR